MKKLVSISIPVLLAAFGWLATNYADHSDPEKLAHHREWAAEHGLPAPTRDIHHAGVAGLVVGSFALGWLLGRPRKRG